MTTTTDDLVGPKKRRTLPRVPTAEEVSRLLRAPDLTTKEGLRDRALLELMYATGLRISEAICLTHRDLSLRSRILRCHGKGNKERRQWVLRKMPCIHGSRPACLAEAFHAASMLSGSASILSGRPSQVL
jgi:site-specific recombinase XerD